MKVLGIHDGHTATACIMEDGKLIAMVSEERLLHEKEKGGFPKNAIMEVLKLSNTKPQEVQIVAVATLTNPLLPDEFNDPGFPRNIYQMLYKFFPRKFLQSDVYVKALVDLNSKISRRKEMIYKQLEELGISADVVFVEHHLAHASSAYFGSGFEDALVLTLDGAGDGKCGTCYTGKDNNLELQLSLSAYNSVGEFYTRITEYLGMKPLSHEYKVMGLAPYANRNRGMKAYERIRDFFKVENGRILNNSGSYKKDYLKLFAKKLFKVRFDEVAFAAQKLLEDTVFEWIDQLKGNWNRLAVGGGVFMNVKMNYGLLERFDEVFVMPSCGDESLAFGVCAYVMSQRGIRVEPLKHLYLGREFGEKEVEQALSNLDEGKFKIEKLGNDIHEFTAELLSKGYIVARFFGRAEWGARALGNRSILADPRNLEVVQRINRAIKKRDFWMPFAPSVLDEVFEDYFVVPKRTKSEKFMILAYPTKEHTRKLIPAAIHQADFTGRPQVVYEEDNPTYYKLIRRFKEITGVGAVLNTSFNLHGYPIVYNPDQAIFTFLNSELDALAIGEYIVMRK